MSINIDFLTKQESINCGEKDCHTEEMITVTIALAEYRSLVAENERLNCEISRLRELTDQAIEEKETIKRQWETQQKLWESRNTKECEPMPQRAIKHTLTSEIKKGGANNE